MVKNLRLWLCRFAKVSDMLKLILRPAKNRNYYEKKDDAYC